MVNLKISDEERILYDVLDIPVGYCLYLEKGKDFVKVKDKETGKTFQIKIKEIKK